MTSKHRHRWIVCVLCVYGFKFWKSGDSGLNIAPFNPKTRLLVLKSFENWPQNIITTKQEKYLYLLVCTNNFVRISVLLDTDASVRLFNSLRPSDAYIYADKFIIIGSDNGLSPGQHQAIIWTNAGILLFVGHLWTNFSEILTKFTFFIQENVFENVVGKMTTSMHPKQKIIVTHIVQVVFRDPYQGSR